MQRPADALVTEQLSALFVLLSRSHVDLGPVSRPDYAFLALVAKLGARRAADLAEAGALDPSTTSRRVAALVDRGYLERTADPGDGRARLVVLTEAGRAVLEDERRRRVELVGIALEDWPDADRSALADLLDRLRTSLGRVATTTNIPVRSVAGSSTGTSPAPSERTPA